ncbi:calcium-binding protein [Alterinioella nitratireducens]|uniref:calcium-binding protein n=1 Tax=Alterinioella nitratireducens TaxID=2735915 RepID=UPI0040599B47
MPLNKCAALALAVLVTLTAPTRAEDTRAFIYGNSLMNHVSGSDETTVPHWLRLLAEAGGQSFAASGVFGSGPEFAGNLPPEPNWSFAEVPQAWDSDRLAFRRAGFDTVILNIRNFIQDEAPDAPYAWDNPDGQSPLSTTLRIFDWTAFQAPGARFYIYEGWSDMSLIADSFPPSDRQLRRYHDYNAGEYHDWFRRYVALVQAERPELDIRLIPTARVLSRLLTETPLADIPVTGIYEDDAPHGTPTLYFLAALVTYATLYDEAPPRIELPDTVHPLVATHYDAITALVQAEVSGSAWPDHAGTPPATGLTDPALAMGLNGIADWSTQLPFIDLMRSARPWVGHLPGQWGGVTAEDLQAGGHLDAAGWPLSLPEGVERLESFILTDLPEGASDTIARYRVTWEGQGDFDIGGRAEGVTVSEGQAWFSFTPGEGPVALIIRATDAQDPIRNITVLREDHIALYELGEVFNPDWTRRIRDLRVVRFMDWMDTNGSEQEVWDDRPRVTDYTYIRRGVPVELLVRLANEIGADPWFTLPHRADDAYYRAFAEYVEAELDPDLIAYVEWSNEAWNFIFPQARWAGEQAAARWDGAEGDAWMQYGGLRAAQMADIWGEVFAGQEHRLIRVISTQTAWPGLEEGLLEAPLAQAEGLDPPAASFDAYALGGYFGYELGTEEYVDRLRGWIDEGTATQEATAALRDGSVAELIEEFFPYHAEVAQRYGLRLIMYEGGTHVVGHGAAVEDETLTAFFTRYNYSQDMAAIYADLLAGWRAAGGTLFNAFVDVSAPTRFGSWGALRHLEDANPRWATLMDYNATAGGGWEDRPEGAFAQGRYIHGSDAGDRLEGTEESDVMLAGPGDDVMILTPGDRAHGGAGQDRAVLPGLASDYALVAEGDLRILNSRTLPTRLVSVEAVEFTGEPGVLYALEPAE